MNLLKIDALVAEKIMGWFWCKPAGFSSIESDLEPDSEGRYLLPSEPPKAKHGFNSLVICVPPYSSDLATAWELMEKFRSIVADLREVKYWTSGVMATPNNSWIAHIAGKQAEAETAPLAICLAALKAVGVDSPKASCPECGNGVRGVDPLCDQHYSEYLGMHVGSLGD